MKHARGFTIIEVAVVVVIISLLITMTLVMYGRVQANARNDASRSKATIITEALEKYYDKNGEYPACAQLTGPSSTVSSNILQGIDPDALTRSGDPTGTSSINCATPSSGGFTYTLNTNAFTLAYKEEATDTVVTLNSRTR